MKVKIMTAASDFWYANLVGAEFAVKTATYEALRKCTYVTQFSPEDVWMVTEGDYKDNVIMKDHSAIIVEAITDEVRKMSHPAPDFNHTVVVEHRGTNESCVEYLRKLAKADGVGVGLLLANGGYSIVNLALEHKFLIQQAGPALLEQLKKHLAWYTAGDVNKSSIDALHKETAELVAKYENSSIIEKHFDKEAIVPERDTFDHDAEIRALMQEALDLHNNHINNGGKLDFPEKEYGWLADEIEDVQVGYFKEDADVVDSDYAAALRAENWSMSLDEATVTLKHRIAEIKSYLE